ncbi:hypothetical protein BDW22DRAFT_1424252 [Trametopsis cervina]|nr:hypothetical protein BDW22DRAFT_1424252 [Trametopsis cervina]
MGSICSKQGTHTGGHRLVDSTDTQSAAQERPDPRIAAAQAAEQRLKATQKRGVVGSNPNSGRLAAQVEANKSNPRAPEQRQEERLVWD